MTRQASRLLIVVLLAVPVSAHSQFMNRRNEVRETIVQGISHEGIQRTVNSGIDGAFELRSKALQRALSLLENDSTSAENVDDEWNHHFQDATGEVVERLDAIADQAEDTISELEDPDQLAALEPLPDKLRALASQQSVLLGNLWRINPAMDRENFVFFRRDYEQAHESMVARRELLRREFRSTESDARTFREEILEASDDLLRALDRGTRELAQYLDSGLSDDPDPSDVDRKVSDYVGDMETALENYDADVAHGLDRLQSVSRRERSQIAMLHETRERIEEMLEEQNAPMAEALFHELEGELNQAGASQPPGDVRDLLEFVPAATQRVEVHLESFESVFVSFIVEFEGIFVEEVDDDTVGEFLYPDIWERWAGDVRRFDVDDYLDTMARDSRNRWGVSLRGMSPEKMDKIERILDDESRRLLDVVNDARRSSGRLERFIGLESRRALREALEG